MTVAIYTKNLKQSKSWLGVLQKELPNQKIEIYPDISDFNSVELLICWKPYKGLIERFPNLKAIQSLGAGVDHIFENSSISSSIQVSKIVDHQLTHDMWEHALSIVLSDMKNLSVYHEQQLDKKWKPKSYRRFMDTTIGILGIGTIGRYVALQFAQLGFEVLGWSRSPKKIERINAFSGKDGLDFVCKNADYLINILPLTEETRGILNKDLFRMMKPSSYIINVGRGQHLIDGDLIDSIDGGFVRGASLDVFHIEPLPESHEFWAHAKISITPHIASLTHIESVYPQVVDNIKRLNVGKPLLNCVNVLFGY